MPLPDRIGQYRLLEPLGSGAMGEVYKAADERMFGRPVALKVLSERLSNNAAARERFKREVEVASRLEHPNIVVIHDRGETSGRPWFVMEFLEGVDLAAAIRDGGARPLFRRIELAQQLAAAIGFAHRHGVIHRDVKPGNVMLVERSGTEIAKLVDFGIVRVERSSLTRAATQPGTYMYMAPEQLRNDAVDARSDLFSMGIVLYELFTGVHPFDAASEPLVAGRILTEEPAPPRVIDRKIPPALDSVLLKLLDKDPEQRPGSAEEVAAALAGLAGRLRSRSLATDPRAFATLDDLSRRLVENLVAWGRRKEAEGDLDEALGAFRKAASLAPEMPRLTRKIDRLRHRLESERELRALLARGGAALEAGNVADARGLWRQAWILRPEDRGVLELESRLSGVEFVDGEDAERGAWVRERLDAAERELECGSTGQARAILAEVLARHPDEALARLLDERSCAVAASGVDYGAYRGALRLAESELEAGRFERARLHCREAGSVWPEDDDWRTIDARVGARVEAEAAAAMARAERLLQQADGGSGDGSAEVALIRQARDAAARAQACGAPPQWVDPLFEDADRLEADLAARFEARTREASERTERARRHADEAVERARAVLERAGALAPPGRFRDDLAIALCEQARAELASVRNALPEHPEAGELAERVDAALRRVAAEAERREAIERDGRERLERAHAAIEAARAVHDDGGRADQDGIDRLASASVEIGSLIAREPDLEDARAALADIEELRRTLERRRDRQLRRRRAVEAALAEGQEQYREARLLASGDLRDLQLAEDRCRLAEQCFARVLVLDERHDGAREAREESSTLREHIRSEILRQERAGRRTAAR